MDAIILTRLVCVLVIVVVLTVIALYWGVGR
jgi:hypothetical protein